MTIRRSNIVVLLFLVLAAALLTNAAVFAATGEQKAIKALFAVQREDLQEKFATMACKNGGKLAALPFEAWRSGIYDAQIEGQILRRTDGLPGRLEDAYDASRQIARVLRYHGMVQGQCPDGSLFAAVFPAGAPLLVNGTVIKLPSSELASRCQEWRIDYAAAHGGKTQRLFSSGSVLDTKALKPGVVTITCQPHSPKWQGPVLWFMYPVGPGPSEKVPALAIEATLNGAKKPNTNLSEIEILRRGLSKWLDNIRRKENVTVLFPSSDLNDEAELLAVDGGLAHNRTLLRHSSVNLKTRNWRFIGENRVKGKDLHEMAWLLWNSPRHRELLLDPKATSYGIGIKRVNGQYLAVLTFGESNLSKVSEVTPLSELNRGKKQ